MTEKNKAVNFDSGRGEYRNEHDKIVRQNNSLKKSDVPNAKVSNPKKANTRDRYENAAPYINDGNKGVSRKIATKIKDK